MKISVKLFAQAKEIAGSEIVELELPEQARVSDLRTAIQERFPKMSSLAASLLIAVGNDYANDTDVIDGKTPVACFPPVSGG
jgi:molybdopterin converting factor small subunit